MIWMALHNSGIGVWIHNHSRYALVIMYPSTNLPRCVMPFRSQAHAFSLYYSIGCPVISLSSIKNIDLVIYLWGHSYRLPELLRLNNMIEYQDNRPSTSDILRHIRILHTAREWYSRVWHLNTQKMLISRTNRSFGVIMKINLTK